MNKPSFSPLYYVFKLIREYLPLVLLYSTLVSLLILAVPISVQAFINTFALGPFIKPLVILTSLLFALLVFLSVLKSLQYLVVEYLQRRIIATVSSAMIYDYTYDENKENKTLTKSNRFFEIMLIQKSLSFLFTDLIAVVLQTILGLILISLYHPFFIYFALITLVLAFLFIYTLGKLALNTSVRESTAKHELAEYIESLVTDDHAQYRENSKEEKIQRGNHFIENYLVHRRSHFFYLFSQNILFMVLFATLNSLLLGLGGYLVMKAQLSVGQLVAAEIILNSILYHFLYAKKYLETFYDLYASSDKIKIFYPSLFPQAFEKQKSAHDVESHFPANKSIPTPQTGGITVKRSLIAVGIIVLLLLFVPWQQTSTGQGQVIAQDPNDRPQFITALVSGRIDELLVRDGQFVKKGQPLIQIIDNDPNFLKRLQSQKESAKMKLSSATQARKTAKFNSDRQKNLYDEGLASRKAYEQARIKYKKLISEEAAAEANLAQAETELSRQALQTVVAPRDGRISKILVGSGTVNVKQGERLLRFVPETENLAVELYLDGNDLPLVNENRPVRLQFDGWPSIQISGWPSVAIGSFPGKILSIDPAVSNTGFFRVLVVPDPTGDPGKWPNTKFLRQGTKAQGLVLLNTVSIGYEIWRKANGFPKSFKKNPNSEFLNVESQTK